MARNPQARNPIARPPQKNPVPEPINRANVAVALFWLLLGLLGIVIATALHVSAIGYLGPVVSLGYGIYDFNRLRLRHQRRPRS